MASSNALRPLAQLISLRTFLPALSSALGCRSFAGAASGSGSSQGEQGDGRRLPSYDPKYRSATELIWPASKHQERFASKVHRALETALMHNDHLRDTLVHRLGFAVKDVRMSPDNLKAFILWDSITGQPGRLRSELNAQGPRLRAAVAAALRARNAPQLVFRHDGLTPQQQEVEEVFQLLDAVAAEEALASAAAAAAEHEEAAGQEGSGAEGGEGMAPASAEPPSGQHERRQRRRR